MKKILTTLTVIAATALGAQGQTTNTNFIEPGLASYSFTNYTFVSNNIVLATTNFIRARLLFAVSGASMNGGRFAVDNITLSGQGITGTATGYGTAYINDNILNPNDITTYPFSAYVDLSNPISSWTGASNLVAFRVTPQFGAAIAPDSQIYYALQYSSGGSDFNSTGGNIAIVAVPEPSAYAAAAGLLALCLWSSRRQLFNLVGSRSATSGDNANCAA